MVQITYNYKIKVQTSMANGHFGINIFLISNTEEKIFCYSKSQIKTLWGELFKKKT